MLLSQDDQVKHALPERVVQGRVLAPTAQGVASALLADAWFNGRHLNFLKIAIGSGPGSGTANPIRRSWPEATSTCARCCARAML